MGKYCPPIDDDELPEGSEVLQFREELVRLMVEFGQHTKLPVGPGAERTMLAIFDSTIGVARAAGEEWDSAAQAFVVRYARVWARESEKAARSMGLDCITAQVLESAAERMILRAREAERRRTAA